MSAAAARDEVRRGLKLRRRVPRAHPYGVAPLWTPYPIARLVGRFCGWLEAAARRRSQKQYAKGAARAAARREGGRSGRDTGPP